MRERSDLLKYTLGDPSLLKYYGKITNGDPSTSTTSQREESVRLFKLEPKKPSLDNHGVVTPSSPNQAHPRRRRKLDRSKITSCIKAIGEESKQRTKIEPPKKDDSVNTTTAKKNTNHRELLSYPLSRLMALCHKMT